MEVSVRFGTKHIYYDCNVHGQMLPDDDYRKPALVREGWANYNSSVRGTAIFKGNSLAKSYNIEETETRDLNNWVNQTLLLKPQANETAEQIVWRRQLYKWFLRLERFDLGNIMVLIACIQL